MFKVFTIIAIISYNILINLLKKRISDMSLLTVTGLTHGFGDRAIFNNVSFQLMPNCLSTAKAMANKARTTVH